jgi:hypothetical protein
MRMKNEVERALDDPAAVFDTPESVLAADLSRDQKIEILRRWEFDMRELLVAEEENMAGGESSALLSRVRQALQSLRVASAPSGPATKHGP